MANGITDLGNNIGYLYKTLADGTTIMAVERNTIEGAKSIQQMGVTNGPIVAGRGAQGEIIVSSSGGAGAITNIDVAGVNQIGANITVTSTNTSVVAAQIAAAINGFTPGSGYKFTASVITNRVYLFSSPADGDAVNGLTITVSVTDPGIVTTTTDFVNGSSDFGIYDNTLGYRFYINADYSGVATPYTIGVKSVEITEYITVRGLQSGIMTVSRTVTNDRISSITRASAFTQVIVDTQGGLPTDVLAYINPAGFVEGDTLIIRGLDPANVVTIEDATTTTSPVATPNIYLTDQTPYSLTGLSSIQLQFRNDPTLGPIWVENLRAITNAPVVTTLAQFNADAGASALRPGIRYYISDLSTGVYVYALSNSTYETSAILRRWIPTNYVGCWRAGMAAPAINSTYRYYQNNYKSLTGAVGSTPDTDAVNWQLLPYSYSSYLEVFNNVILSAQTLLSWAIIQEEDSNGNTVIQSYKHFLASGKNAFNIFCWNQVMLIGQRFTGNYVCDSVFDVANSDGSVYDNQVTGGSNFSLNTMDLSSLVNGNTITNGSIIQGNVFRSFTGNTIDSGLVQNNFLLTNKAPNITYNRLNGGYIISNYASTVSAFIRNNTINVGSSIQANNLGTHGIIESNTLSSVSQLQNSSIVNNTNPSHIFNNTFNNCIFEFVQSGAGDSTMVYNNTFNTGAFTLINTGGSSNVFDSVFNNTNISVWNTYGADKAVFNNCNIVAQLKCLFQNISITGWSQAFPFDHSVLGAMSGANVIVGVSSNLTYTLDLDNPAIYAANTLTFNYAQLLGGVFYLSSVAASKTIDDIVGLPEFQTVTFYNATLGVCNFTFNKVAPGAWAGNKILADANFTLSSDASGASDYMTMTKFANTVNMITAGINF